MLLHSEFYSAVHAAVFPKAALDISLSWIEYLVAV
jgi:hypothetical protein